MRELMNEFLSSSHEIQVREVNNGRQWLRGRVAVLEHRGFPKGSQFDPGLPQS